MAITGDVEIIKNPHENTRFRVKLLSLVKTTSDNNKWVGVAGARDMTVHISGFNNGAAANSADVDIRVHNSRTLPANDDSGFSAYGATRDVAIYLAGPVEWIKADMTRITSIDQWDSAMSVDVDVVGVY